MRGSRQSEGYLEIPGGARRGIQFERAGFQWELDLINGRWESGRWYELSNRGERPLLTSREWTEILVAHNIETPCDWEELQELSKEEQWGIMEARGLLRRRQVLRGADEMGANREPKEEAPGNQEGSSLVF